MTKHRPPLTFDADLARVVGQLPGNWAEAAIICGRATSTVRNWGNPDLADAIPIECARDLDLAFRRAGGIGAPFYEAYTVQLELAAADRFAAPAALMQLLPDVLKENNDAELAILSAARPDADRRELRDTLREIEEALGGYKRVHHLLTELINTAVVPQATGPPD